MTPSGALIRAYESVEEDLEDGTPIRLVIMAPKRIIELDGYVRWRASDIWVGVQFVDLSDEMFSEVGESLARVYGWPDLGNRPTQPLEEMLQKWSEFVGTSTDS